MSSSSTANMEALANAVRSAIELANLQLASGVVFTHSNRQSLVDLHSSLTSVILATFDSDVQQNVPVPTPSQPVSEDNIERLMAQLTWEDPQGSTTISIAPQQASPPANNVPDIQMPPGLDYNSIEYAKWFYDNFSALDVSTLSISSPKIPLFYDYSTELSFLADEIDRQIMTDRN
ncbi:hypothetical protein VNI00_003737 [Paramarasmius palmivorus]|uniref:Uncharacterized protein n=1 Tax=Paramarasmius palmivorus TaxID=297713 RepID=A0AAW0DT58_9AGAR